MVTAPPTLAEHTDLVPLIDMDQWRTGTPTDRQEIAAAVDAALSEVGFLILTGHGIPTALIDAVRRASAATFALPLEAKQKYRQTNGIGGAGWTPIGAEANAYASGQPTPPDLKETWTVGPVAEGAVNPPRYPETTSGEHLMAKLMGPRAGDEVNVDNAFL